MPTQTIQKQIKEALKEFENNLHENKLVEEDKYSPYFDTAHVRVQELLSMFSEHLFTIATKSAEEGQIKSIPLSVMDIALFESLKINQHFGRRLNYPELKKFGSVSNWLKYLKKTNSFSDEAFRDFREEIKLLYELSKPKESNQ